MQKSTKNDPSVLKRNNLSNNAAFVEGLASAAAASKAVANADGGSNDASKALLSFYLLIEDSKSDVFNDCHGVKLIIYVHLLINDIDQEFVIFLLDTMMGAIST